MTLPSTYVRQLPPEVDLLALSFLGHFAWEMLQAPLFSSMSEVSHFAGIYICLKATLGDLAIALSAFWIAARVGRSRSWFIRPGRRALVVFFAVGLLLTIGLEYVHTQITGRWAYDGVMPVLPVIGTGLTPILQWIFVPMLVLWYMRRLDYNIGQSDRP
ncbi:hypothetical protein ACOI1H_16745 [Loktanella sp. DJP18]|uniref:hypothetical protein n=1 Tax=Loktanella sp. DJP18 TaxID=3409788 RepID=UPI003BB5F628